MTNALEVGYLQLGTFLEEPLGTEPMRLKEEIVLPNPNGQDAVDLRASVDMMLSPEGSAAQARGVELLQLIQRRQEDLHREIDQLRGAHGGPPREPAP